uniref:Uncharacterized protein n=1 Tax=Candidatus Methanogaster sp. ANME-2c ERB4 TaxID=2759911 RepID=A0A7G9YRP4_9EURY|nr:hypothetical protein FFGHKCHG_00032 [Methanosarcinales archaeon ANME-2c ERB4]
MEGAVSRAYPPFSLHFNFPVMIMKKTSTQTLTMTPTAKATPTATLTSIILVLTIGIALTIGAGCVGPGQDSQSYNVTWTDTQPDDHTAIETQVSRQIAPYPGVAYSNVTISKSKKDGDTHLRVSATLPGCQYPDLYDFVYQDQKLTRTGYLLEAIPDAARQDAIGIAMQNPDIAGALPDDAGAGIPTVRRILPETAAEFYAEKTCVSVTWADASVSALVDTDTGSVVETWGADTMDERVRNEPTS